jgi:hypothetical protein
VSVLRSIKVYRAEVEGKGRRVYIVSGTGGCDDL